LNEEEQEKQPTGGAVQEPPKAIARPDQKPDQKPEKTQGVPG
jgi:hypothetical protein